MKGLPGPTPLLAGFLTWVAEILPSSLPAGTPYFWLSRTVRGTPGVLSTAKLYTRRIKYILSQRKENWQKNLWSPSYFAGSCGGAPLAVIKQYVKQQQSPS